MLTTENEGPIISRYNENNAAVFITFVVVVSNDKRFSDEGELCSVVDDSDECTSERVDGPIRGELEATETSGVENELCVESLEKSVLLGKQVSVDSLSDQFGAFGGDEVLKPHHVCVRVDDRRFVFVGVNNTCFFTNGVLVHQRGIAFKAIDLEKQVRMLRGMSITMMLT